MASPRGSGLDILVSSLRIHHDAPPAIAALVSLALSFSRFAIVDVERPSFYIPNLDGVDDWRDLVPRHLRDLWPNLSFESRLVAYIAANTERIAGE
jgi:hypothetical protein